MGLDFAIDELYATGWTALDTQGCLYHSDGRPYPSCSRVLEEFTGTGCKLSIRRIQLFDCHRAEWSDQAGAAVGAVVGHSESEAAVYALSQLRRSMVVAHC
jgi:hypothetical protein